MKNLSLPALAAILLFAAASFAQDPAPARKDAVQDTISELVKKGFNLLVPALSKTEYESKLASGEFTLLAPSDAAFRDLPKAQLDALLMDKAKLTQIFSHHIIAGKISTAELKAGKVKTLGGSEVQAKVVDGKLKIGAATIVRPDVPSTNGMIHGIDKILLP